MPMISLDEQLAEVDRELAMRRRLYPRWAASGTLPQAQGDRQIAVLEAVRETVRLARSAQMMAGMDGKPIR